MVSDAGFTLDSYLSSTAEFNSVSALVYSNLQQFTGSGTLFSVDIAVGADCEVGRYDISFAAEAWDLPTRMAVSPSPFRKLAALWWSPP